MESMFDLVVESRFVPSPFCSSCATKPSSAIALLPFVTTPRSFARAFKAAGSRATYRLIESMALFCGSWVNRIVGMKRGIRDLREVVANLVNRTLSARQYYWMTARVKLKGLCGRNVVGGLGGVRFL
jgi:hypothetical protein